MSGNLRSSANKHSPGWQNPREVIKRTLRKKNLSQVIGRRQLSLELDADPSTSYSQPAFSDISSAQSDIGRRKNPFLKSPKKHHHHSRGKRKLRNDSVNSENFRPEPETVSNLYSALEHQERDAADLNDQPTDFSMLLEGQIDEPRSKIARKRSGSDRSQQPLESSQNLMDGSSMGIFARKHSTPKIATVKQLLKESSSPPPDRRLATKVRIVSAEPFPWVDLKTRNTAFIFKATEKSVGMKLFMEENDRILEAVRPSNMAKDSFIKAQLHANSLYYCHPDLPWLGMFPRLEDSKKPVVTSVASLGSKITSSVACQWSSSFDNLYYSLKGGLTSSFYVCCPSFTVMFLNTPAGKCADDLNQSCSSSSSTGTEEDGMKAIISVTTSAIRQALRDEGIKFTLPYRPGSRRGSTETVSSCATNPSFSGENSSSSTSGIRSPLDPDHSVTNSQPPFLHFRGDKSLGQSYSCNDLEGLSNSADSAEEKEELDSSGNSEDQEEWMKDIGISPGQAQKFNRKVSFDKLPTTCGTVKEEKLKSVALVCGTFEVHCIYNFILNSPLCKAQVGPQAGLPPTLISRKPFVGGALRSLETKSVIQKRDNRDHFVLDLSGGPVLPDMVHLLCGLLEQEGVNRFTVTSLGKDGYLGMNLGTEQKGVADSVQECLGGSDGGFSREFDEMKYEFGKYRY